MPSPFVTRDPNGLPTINNPIINEKMRNNMPDWKATAHHLAHQLLRKQEHDCTLRIELSQSNDRVAVHRGTLHEVHNHWSSLLLPASVRENLRKLL